MKNRAEARIDLAAIKSNANEIKASLSDNCEFMAVVKADAYGHGAVAVSKSLMNIGIRHFAVASIDEANELRTAGVTGELLILGKTAPSRADELIAGDITQAVECLEYAKALSEAGKIKVHIKIDTGMSRFGIYCHSEADSQRAAAEIESISALPNIDIRGIFTHFADADNPNDLFTEKQFSSFKSLCDLLDSKGIKRGLRHCCNSAATLRYKEKHLDMVRVGIALYGLELSVPEFPLIPAMSVFASLASVSEIRTEDTVSYGRTYKAERYIKKGVVSFGYADGMPRLLSNRYKVTINGKKAPILGRICMDLFIVDLSDIECSVGDEVKIFGAEGGASEIAEIIGTINYEIVCGISKRVPRIYT